MSIKKIICVLLAVVMLFALASCGKPEEAAAPGTTGPETQTSPATTVDETTAVPETESAPESSAGSDAEEAKLPGVLYQVNLAEGYDPILRGLSLSGNRLGSAEFNSKDASDEGIRCVFALNEWVEFYPDTVAESGIKVYVIKHREDQKSYETETFSDELPDVVAVCDLEKDPDPEVSVWGSFYLNPDDVEPGYFDFVFTFGGNAIATLLTRFYAEGELDGKTDEQLEKIAFN